MRIKEPNLSAVIDVDSKNINEIDKSKFREINTSEEINRHQGDCSNGKAKC